MYNYEAVEEEKKYEFYKKTDLKTENGFFIKRGKGNIIYFPYSYITPLELEKQEDNYYTLALLGGGMGLILHFKNLNESKAEEFLKYLRSHKLDYLYEFVENTESTDFPILQKVEVLDLKKQRL